MTAVVRRCSSAFRSARVHVRQDVYPGRSSRHVSRVANGGKGGGEGGGMGGDGGSGGGRGGGVGGGAQRIGGMRLHSLPCM